MYIVALGFCILFGSDFVSYFVSVHRQRCNIATGTILMQQFNQFLCSAYLNDVTTKLLCSLVSSANTLS